MASITTRSGKGSALTHTELDNNFTNLNNDKLEVATASSTYLAKAGGTMSGNITFAAGQPTATTSAPNIVQLVNSISSTSTTTAATPNSVKLAYDLADAALPKSGGTLTGNVDLSVNNGTIGFRVLQQGSGAALVVTQLGSGDALLVEDENNDASPFVIKADGKVGIGRTDPGSALDIKGTLRLSGSSSGYVGLAPAAAAGSTTFTLPSADGSSGQALTTNGSGVLGWTTILPDGDKGDITVTSGTWTIDPGVVTYSKIQDVSATDRLLGRSSAGAGSIEEITCTAAGRSLLSGANASAQRTTLGLAIGSDVQAFDANTAKTNAQQTFTAAQTFRATTAIRVEAAATQDAIILAGRAGGTSSRTVTITPSALGDNRTLTLADGDTTLVPGTMVPTSRTITVSTADGVTGGGSALDLSANRSWSLGLTGQALALHNLSSNGLIARTGAGTVAARAIVVTGSGISISNGDGISGNPTLASNATDANTPNAIVARDASGNFSAGTLTLTSFSYSGNPTTTSTGALQVPSGTTAQRPTPAAGQFRYNSNLLRFEGYNGTAWGGVGGGATGGGTDTVFVENGQTVTTNYELSNGKNAVSAGPITINTGVTVTIPSGASWVIV